MCKLGEILTHLVEILVPQRPRIAAARIGEPPEPSPQHLVFPPPRSGIWNPMMDRVVLVPEYRQGDLLVLACGRVWLVAWVGADGQKAVTGR